MPRMNAATQNTIPHPFQATEGSDSRRDNIGQRAEGAEAGSATVSNRCIGQPGPGRECGWLLIPCSNRGKTDGAGIYILILGFGRNPDRATVC
jgi:hypothetical protein